MNKYEMVVLAKPTLNDEELNTLKVKLFDLIKDNDGKLLFEDEYKFVLKKTAYEVKTFNKANYIAVQFESETNVLEELERVIKITDDIIKYMIIRLDEKTDVEKLTKVFNDDSASQNRDRRDYRRKPEAKTEEQEEEKEETTESEGQEEAEVEETEEVQEEKEEK